MPTAPSNVFATAPAPAPAYTYTYAAPATVFAPGYTYAAPAAAPTYTYAAPAYTYAAPALTAAAAYTYGAATGGGDVGDAYGFTNWLNGVRAQYGLGAVSFDANLAGWAASNNAQQAVRGMGHHVMGPARRQNSAMGSSSSIGQQWMNSPAHRDALLDPSITAIGLAGNGSYWTFNAR